MPVDLIIYAVVAVGLVFWLRSILGTRHGDERTRQNPLIVTPQDNAPNAGAGSDIDMLIRGAVGGETAEDKIRFLLDNPQDVIGIDARAMSGLMDIAAADKNFDVKDFLTKVQDAFAIIVESFAEGDTDTLESLLQADVFTAFETAVRDRAAKGETQTTDVLSFKTAHIMEAALQEKVARITVMFVANETTVVRASDGDIISGHPDKVLEMRDVWVFARDIKSRDPRWLLAETKGNIEDDNLLIPNTD